jgi:alpha-tubulin suppressor-like RCC1 family protein
MRFYYLAFICFFVCIYSFPTNDISQVSSGGYFTAVITKSNEIWVVGFGNGNGGTKINNTVGIDHIVCGGYHCLGLNKETGLVYYLDIVNGKQKLSDGNYSIEAVLVEPFQHERIIKISTGFNHSIAITDKGRVYSWGENRNAKLGHIHYDVDEGEYIIPKLVNVDSQVIFKDGCCGGDFTLLLDEQGRVWSFGINNNGQLGREGDMNIPTMIDSLRVPIEKFCGGDHSFLLADNSTKLYSFGWGEKGQLGHGSFQDEREPRLIPSLNDGVNMIDISSIGIKDISVSGYGHTILLANNNQVYTCGWNEYQQLGLGHQVDVATLTLIPELNGIASIQNNHGFKHSCFLTDSNKVVAIGDNEHGQIGLGNEEAQNELDKNIIENALSYLKEVNQKSQKELL